MNDFDDIAATIRQLQGKRHQAMAGAHLELLDAMLDEALIYTHSDASRDRKSSYLQKVRDGVFDYDEVVSSEEEVTVLTPDTALVSGRMHLVGRLAGATKRFDNRFLAVWVRRHDGQWRLAAFQPTPTTVATSP